MNNYLNALIYLFGVAAGGAALIWVIRISHGLVFLLLIISALLWWLAVGVERGYIPRLIKWRSK